MKLHGKHLLLILDYDFSIGAWVLDGSQHRSVGSFLVLTNRISSHWTYWSHLKSSSGSNVLLGQMTAVGSPTLLWRRSCLSCCWWMSAADHASPSPAPYILHTCDSLLVTLCTLQRVHWWIRLLLSPTWRFLSTLWNRIPRAGIPKQIKLAVILPVHRLLPYKIVRLCYINTFTKHSRTKNSNQVLTVMAIY